MSPTVRSANPTFTYRLTATATGATENSSRSR